MRKVLVLFLFLCIVLSASPNEAIAMNNEDIQKIKHEEQMVQDERKNLILIKYNDTAPKAKARVASMPEVVEQTEILPNIELLKIKEEIDANQLVKELSKNESVEAVELNGVSHIMGEVMTLSEDWGNEEENAYHDLLEHRLNNNEGQAVNLNQQYILEKQGKLLEKTESVRPLSVTQDSLTDTIFEREPNNTLDTANNITIDKYVYGTITDVYFDLDYYRLRINNSGKLNILGVFEYPQYLAIGLLDERGNNLAWSRLINGEAQYLQENVTPGTYYIIVFQISDYQYLCTNEAYLFQTWMTDVKTSIPVSSVSLNKTNITLHKGESETLNAVVYPLNATNKSVTWSSSNPSIATVDNNGMVTAVKEGKTTITAKTHDGGKTASCKVQVSELPTNNNPAVVNDPLYSKQWWLESVNAPLVWQKINNIKPVVVAVIDSGIDLSHEDLRSKVAPGGYNFIFDNYDVYDINGHGTAVSGVIAAEANNHKGITGVAGPLDVKVLPLQAGFYDGTLYTSDVIRAIRYAIDQEVDVINLSFGSNHYFSIENAAVQEAINRGVVVVAAAGNDGDGLYCYPASLENVISVGAISPRGEISSFSNHNDKIDFVAPGEYVFTTQIYNSYDYNAGTSLSTPIVSGVASLMKAVNPSLSPREITRELAKDSLDKGRPGKDDYYGHGLINAHDTIIRLVPNLDKDYTELPEKTNVPMNKGWKITFNLKLNPKTVSGEQIYIKDSNNNTIYSVVQVGEDGKSVLISPLENYNYGQKYYLYIEDQIESETGAKLKKPVRMKFSIGSKALMDNEGEGNQSYQVLSL